jgi:hypothetical protein
VKRLRRQCRDVLDTVSRALVGVEAGMVTPAVAHAIAALSHAYLAVYETSEVESRIAALEEQAKNFEGWHPA